MTLLEFLTDRLVEDKEAELARMRADFYEGIPNLSPNDLAVFDRLAIVKQVEFGYAVRQAGLSLLDTFMPRRLRRRASAYADHPDYRPEWRLN